MAIKKTKLETMELNGRTVKIHEGPVGVYRTAGSVVFDIFNYVFVGLIALTTVLPIIYIIFNSFATEFELTTRSMFIIPHTWSVDAYTYIFSSNKILRSFGNSILITVAGTAINLFFTVTFAYALSKKFLRGRNIILNLVIISMFFSAGMIPGYIVVASWLRLRGTYWALLLPGAISAYNMMIVKNFFQGIPAELEESANLDGCNDLQTLWKIVLPLSGPVLATFGCGRYVPDGSQLCRTPEAVHQDGCYRGGHRPDHVRLSFPAEVLRQGRYGWRSEGLMHLTPVILPNGI